MDDVGMLMLRRRTDPKTEDHTLCETAQSKRVSTFNISQEPLYTDIYSKNAAAQIEPGTWTHTSCEPAESKCM